MAFSPATIPVDRASPVPLYYQVALEIQRAIESGELSAGTRLESEIALAQRIDVSRPTMRKAIEYLVARGYVVRKRGVGTVVMRPKVRRPLELSSLYDDLASTGKQPTTRVLALETQPAPIGVAEALGIDEGTPVIAFERLRYTLGRPLALMRNHVPAGLLSVDAEALETTGLYQLMRAAGIRLQLASQTIGARSATVGEARVLHSPKGATLLTMQRTTYDDKGRPVEVGDHLYRASDYSFEFVLSSR
jgi:DNA-binding GntR family transcriptional regulator